MKKVMYISISLIYVSVSYSMSLIVNAPDYNTRYTAQYSEEKFDMIKEGNTIQEVKSLLGNPANIYNEDYFDAILYHTSNFKIEIYNNSTGIDNTNDQFILIWFDSNGKVKTFYIFNYEKKTSLEQKLEQLTKNEIIKFLGQPDDSVTVPPLQFYEYSKSKEGTTSGVWPEPLKL
jgi:outer membrane protein assembly factor BamE (lipoprotein component of BamABCDE complex)